jgi:hypothetical protein
MNKRFAYTIVLSVACLISTVWNINANAFNRNTGKAGNTFISSDKYPSFNVSDITLFINSKVAGKTTIGFSQKGNPVEAYYFPGTSNKRALIIGGVHGSELAAIEVAKELIKQLQNGTPSYYSVIIVPCLFPDNAATALRSPSQIGGTGNIGRYTHAQAVDPNRQMPSLGKQFDPQTAYDNMGRVIEKENQLLLQLMNEFKPQRIVNLHAIRDTEHAGIYADPRTDSRGIALGYETDSSLAVDMARYIHRLGGRVPGNELVQHPVALYYKDPGIAPKGFLQKRNISSSVLIKGKGQGVSLGGWASTAIEDAGNPVNNRVAIRLITAEFPGSKRPADYETITEQNDCRRLVQLYAAAIKTIFLGNHYTEEDMINSAEGIAKK